MNTRYAKHDRQTTWTREYCFADPPAGAHNFSHFVYANIMHFSRTAVLLAALTLVSANTLVEEKNGVVSDSDASPTMKRYLKGRNPVRSLSLFIYIWTFRK